MTFTAESSRVFVEVRNLNVNFRLKINAPNTLRGEFVDWFRAPLRRAFKRTDYLHALKDIQFSAENGDRIAILGRNGSGKSTLCRCLAGIMPHAQGQIRKQGSLRALLDPNLVIYPDLTGRENADLLMRLMYPDISSRDDRQKMLNEALEFSGLGPFLNTPYRFYSNGMQSRLCLSVATAKSADIFILDEVFEAADQAYRSALSQRIFSLIRESGIVFFVSHQEDQVRRVCNKALVLDRGSQKYFGPLENGLQLYQELLNADANVAHI